MADPSAALPHARPLTSVRPRGLASLRAISALMLREMATTYGRSPLGYLWALLEPVAGIALLTAVFSILVRQPPLGNNFAIFYATGIVPFMAYMDISSKMMMSLTFSRALLAYPRVTFMDALLARFLLAVLTQALVGLIVFTGIRVVYETRTVISLTDITLGYAMMVGLAFGVGTLNCFISGMITSWPRIWAILNRPMFLISCTFFLLETIPQPYRDWLWYNPLVHVVAQVRKGFYPYYDAAYVSFPYVFAIVLVTALFGILLLRRYARYILNG